MTKKKIKRAAKKPSRKRPVGKRAKATRKRVKEALNPGKALNRRVAKTTAWIRATHVKIVKRRGKPDQVLIRKPRQKRR